MNQFNWFLEKVWFINKLFSPINELNILWTTVVKPINQKGLIHKQMFIIRYCMKESTGEQVQLNNYKGPVHQKMIKSHSWMNDLVNQFNRFIEKVYFINKLIKLINDLNILWTGLIN